MVFGPFLFVEIPASPWLVFVGGQLSINNFLDHVSWGPEVSWMILYDRWVKKPQSDHPIHSNQEAESFSNANSFFAQRFPVMQAQLFGIRLERLVAAWWSRGMGRLVWRSYWKSSRPSGPALEREKLGFVLEPQRKVMWWLIPHRLWIMFQSWQQPWRVVVWKYLQLMRWLRRSGRGIHIVVGLQHVFQSSWEYPPLQYKWDNWISWNFTGLWQTEKSTGSVECPSKNYPWRSRSYLVWWSSPQKRTSRHTWTHGPCGGWFVLLSVGKKTVWKETRLPEYPGFISQWLGTKISHSGKANASFFKWHVMGGDMLVPTNCIVVLIWTPCEPEYKQQVWNLYNLFLSGKCVALFQLELNNPNTIDHHC